ncbi:MAG: tetratricopeptide repeat-containing sensor histidine kinase, partial [Bacteroidota bacterium]|nr:tetratricopeptide repeat-containing sensor histidine kinase [Bacteroidota bacterium]
MSGCKSYSTPHPRFNDLTFKVAFLILAFLHATPSSARPAEASYIHAHPSPTNTYPYVSQPDTAEVNNLIREFLKVVGSDLVLAEQYADQALAMSTEINYAVGLMRSYRAKGDVFRIRGNFQESERFNRDAISLSEKEHNEIELAKGDLAMYRLLFSKGEYQAAAEFNKRPMEIGQKLSSAEVLAEAYGNEGIIYGMKGEHVTSVERFLKSLELYKARDDDSMVGMTLGRIGHTFELAGSFNKALDYSLQALEVNRRLNDFSNIGWNLLNIGVIYSRLEPENYDKKIGYYNQALAMAEKADNFRLILTCLDNIGGAYSVQGDFAKANHYLTRAYKLSQSAGHNSRTVFITGNLAENYLYMGKLDSALLLGKENLRIALREQNAFEMRQAYSVLSQVYAARNDHKIAYQMLSRHLAISDSIFNAQKSQQIEDLREKYETEKKEQEIESLTLEKSAAEFRRNTFAVLALLFLALGVMVFIVLRQRMKRNRLLLQKELELDRMKSRFFANISHEFRTPLTLILGPLDDMLGRNEDSDHLRYLRPMRKNAARLLELVNQLLELSRIESGKMTLTLSRTDVVSLVKGITMSFDSLAEMKNIRLEVTSSEEKIATPIDRDKLEKILTNLLSNAFKFTPQDGHISVSIARSTGNRLPDRPECIEITVTDNGDGIAKADLDHIFDRFYQADNNQLHQHDGSGIGLALTKELVELHGGVIWAESQPEKGTVIHIQLPTNLDV